MSGLLDKPSDSAPPPADPSLNRNGLGKVRRWIGTVGWATLKVVTLGLAGVSLAAYCGRLGWLFELTSHFRWQYGVLLAGSSFCYLLGRRWQAGLAAGFLSIANLCLVVSIGSPPPRPDDRTVVRAIVCNVLEWNRKHEPLLQFIRGAKPDLVVLLEVNFAWRESLRALDDAYPYRRVSPANNGWGMALLSRIPFEDVEQVTIGESDGILVGGTDRDGEGTDMALSTGNALAIAARLRIDGQPLTVIGTHVRSPVSAARFEARNRQLADLAVLSRRQQGPVLLLADLNSSPWSPYFQDLLSASRLRDSRQGFGIQASWPTYFSLAQIPIDHCLVSREIAVHGRVIGPKVGSDHFPVVIDFSLWPQSGE